MNAAGAARGKARYFGLPDGDLAWHHLIRLYGLPCAYCGRTPALSADHIVPLGKGGPNDLANMAPACRGCNEKKGPRDPEEWKRASEPYPCRDCGDLLERPADPKRWKPILCADCLGISRRRRMDEARRNRWPALASAEERP